MTANVPTTRFPTGLDCVAQGGAVEGVGEFAGTVIETKRVGVLHITVATGGHNVRG